MGTSLTDVLPSGLTFQSLSAPAGWTLSTPAIGTSGTIKAVDTAQLAADATANFSLVVRTSNTTPGFVITNSASVAPATFDPITNNNSVTLPFKVPGAAGVDIHGQPASAFVGQPIGGPINVAVVDSNGNTIPDSTQLVTLAIFTGPNHATLGGTTTVRAENGVATFTNLTLDLAGNYTLTATGGTLTADFSNSFTISALNVSKILKVRRSSVEHGPRGSFTLTFTITNMSNQALKVPLALVFEALPPGVALSSSNGHYQGRSQIEVLAPGQSLARGKHLNVKVVFTASGGESNKNQYKLVQSFAVFQGV